MKRVLVLLALLLFAGCGEDNSNSNSRPNGPGADTALSAALERTLQARTAEMVVTYEGDMEAMMRQDADFETDRASGSLSFDRVRGQPELSGMSGQIYADGPRTLARFPEITAEWIELNQDLGGAFENQPSALFKSLNIALQDVEATGPRTSGSASEYRAVYDLRALIEQAPTPPPEGVQQQLETAPSLEELPFSASVDDDGFVRRVVLSLPEEVGNLEMTLELSDIGAPVDIGPPPADVVEEPGPG